MTENKAKEYMENEIRCIQRANYCDRDCAKCSLVKEEEPLLEAFKEAIKALEEIQEYRELGSVEEILKAFNNQRGFIASQQEILKHCGVVLKQYRAIGTVEECQAAVEKMKPKKPIKKDGILYCPCCGEIPSTDTGDSFVDYYVPYCLDCGQHIDLED